MNYPNKLILVRHGESLRNVNKKGVFFETQEEKDACQDLSDELVPLTERGIRQAKETGAALKRMYGGIQVRPIFHSGYKRAEDTARYIMDELYPPFERESIRENLLRMDMLLRERTSGHAVNMLRRQVEMYFSWSKEYWKSMNPVLAVPPGGESVADVASTRVNSFLLKLRYDYEGQNVIVVSHGRTILAFRMVIEELSFAKSAKLLKDDPRNCSVTTYQYDGFAKRLRLESYDQVYWQEVLGEK